MDAGADRDRGDSGSERAYRALTRAYPEEVRRRYADEMVRYFGDLYREERLSRGATGVALLWARTLPELLVTALQERGTLFRSNAYLPAAPRMVARWGALCALLGGILGVAFHLISYSLLGALNILTGDYSYGNGPFARFFTLSLLLGALSLSSLGLFGLYGVVVARSSEARPGLLAGAGALFSTVSAALLLSTSGYAALHQLASGSALFAPFEWLWYAGTAVLPLAFLSWLLGLLVLGLAAAIEGRLSHRLRVAPLALFVLIAPSCVALIAPSYYVFGGWFEVVGNPVTTAIVGGLAQSLPFVGIALLGWVLLEDRDAEPMAVSGGPAQSVGAAREARRPACRTADGARSDTPDVERDKEKELLRAIRRHGQLTVTGVALETSLSVEEADRMLSELAGKGHLEVRAEHGRLFYSLWEDRG